VTRQILRLVVVARILVLALLAGCGDGPAPAASCGDGRCEGGESCETCPGDCPCGVLSETPPMGWNSWNRFGCDIDEELIRRTADAMVATGMRDAGYRYLNLDDCWQWARDEDGTILADPWRFPSGIGALADYVHARGLLFGLYTCAGRLTCQERPGSYGYEAKDARTYAGWGVDYVKVDWCFTEGLDPRARYTAMHDALEGSGRRMVHSICNWGQESPWVWGPGVGQLWRTTPDIRDLYPSMLLNLVLTQEWAGFAGPGHWNDPDMLEVGNGGMTDGQYRSHFGLWAMMAAPLIAGNDLRETTPETLEILLNPEAIAVNQDPLGLQAVLLRRQGGIQVWAKPLAGDGERAVLFFNAGLAAEAEAEVLWSELGLAAGPARVRDLWARQDLGAFTGRFSARVPPTGSVLVKVSGSDPAPPDGESWLSDLPWKYAVSTLSPAERDRSTGGAPMTIEGVPYEKGVGVRAASILLYPLGGRCSRFLAHVGVDDEAGLLGSVVFQVWADGALLYDSGMMTGTMPARPVDVSLAGRRNLRLVAGAAGDSLEGDHADWAGARIVCP